MKRMLCLFIGHTQIAGPSPLTKIELQYATYALEVCGRCGNVYCLYIEKSGAGLEK